MLNVIFSKPSSFLIHTSFFELSLHPVFPMALGQERGHKATQEEKVGHSQPTKEDLPFRCQTTRLEHPMSKQSEIDDHKHLTALL